MATARRIEKRRLAFRRGHSVKCWKSKWETCKCKISGSREGQSKYS